jgi:hypothetical protein
MNSQNKNPVIDADAHVVECAHTWDFMDKSEEKYRPIPLEAREEAGLRQQFWLVEMTHSKLMRDKYNEEVAQCR